MNKAIEYFYSLLNVLRFYIFKDKMYFLYKHVDLKICKNILSQDRIYVLFY